MAPDQVIRIGVPPVRIEVLTTISGVSFDLEQEAGRALEGWAIRPDRAQGLNDNHQLIECHEGIPFGPGGSRR